MVGAACVVALVPSRALSGPGGRITGNGSSQAIGISADGRLVAFISSASNLVGGDSNRRDDLFVYDRVSGKLQRSDVGPSLKYWAATEVALSPDLRFLAYSGFRPDGGCRHVFVYDRVTGKTAQADLNTNGVPGRASELKGSCSGQPAISANGRFVAFASAPAHLVADDTDLRTGAWNVFVRDRLTATTELVSVSSGGKKANGSSGGPIRISADGRLVYFHSDATNLGAEAKQGGWFVRDRLTKTTRRISLPVGASGVVFSTDARFVAFSVYRNTNNGHVFGDLYVYEQASGKRLTVHVTRLGTSANSALTPQALSTDGRIVVFGSAATNLAASSAPATCLSPPDFNGAGELRMPQGHTPCTELYVTNRATDKTELVTRRYASTPETTDDDWRLAPPSISADGRYLAFSSFDTRFVPGHDTNNAPDAFLRDLKTHTTTLLSAARAAS